MVVPYSVATNDVVAAEDVNQYKKILEGSSGYTDTFALKSTAATDFVMTLGDSVGANKLQLKSAAATNVASVDSSGNLILAGGATITGNVAITGTLTSGFAIPTGTIIKYKSATQVFTTNTTYADITATSGNFAFTMAASEVWVVDYWMYVTYGGTGGVKMQLTGPAAPTSVIVTAQAYSLVSDASAGVAAASPLLVAGSYDGAPFHTAGFSGEVIGVNSGSSGTDNVINGSIPTIHIHGFIVNGSTAGAVTLQGAQNSSNSTTTFGVGSHMLAQRLV